MRNMIEYQINTIVTTGIKLPLACSMEICNEVCEIDKIRAVDLSGSNLSAQ